MLAQAPEKRPVTMTITTMTKHTPSTPLESRLPTVAAMVTLIFCCASTRAASAALIFQSEFALYRIDTARTQTAAVDVYFAQTGETTVLTDEGGLNSVGFIISPVLGGDSPPTLQSIATNTAFTGASVTSTSAGTLYLEMPNLTAGVQSVGGRVYIGTFTYAGYAGVNESTSFQIADKSGDSTYTAAGTLLDAQIQPGTFTAVVPEPATGGAIILFTMVLVGRRWRFRG